MSNAMLKGAAAVGLAAVLAGCQAMGPPPMRGPVSPPPMAQTLGLEGEWATEDGIAVGRFSPGGSYELIALDTGNRLVEGTYRRNERGVFELSGHSLLRDAPVRNNCTLATPNQLNCTAATGQNSILIRRQGMS